MTSFNEWLNQRDQEVFNEIAQPTKFFTYTTDDKKRIATIAFSQYGEELLQKLFRRNKDYRFNPNLDEPEDGSHLTLDQNLMNMYKDELLTMIKNTPQNYNVDVSPVKTTIQDFFKDESLDKRSNDAFDKIFQTIARMTRRATSRNNTLFLSIDATRQIYDSCP